MHDDFERSDHAIRTDNLTKRYGSGDAAVTAVDGVELRVPTGEVFGFLGPNGAGKSSVINLLLGFTEPTEGTATVLGRDATDGAVELRQHIGVLPENLGLYDRLTGRRHLRFAIDWADADDDPAVLLERVGLDPGDADRPVGSYSTGMRQRLALAMALVNEPALLLLDEPSSGLDPHGISRLRRIVREERDRGATVFFSSHLLEQVEAVSDRVGIMRDGRLTAVDTVEGLRRTVGSGTELRLRLDGPPPTALEPIDGVASVASTDGMLTVETTDSTAKAEVINHLTETEVTILDVTSTTASLEEVFTAYTTEPPTVEVAGR